MATDRIARAMAMNSMNRDAVTEIKLNGTALTKTNGAVNLPAATASQAGVMTAQQAGLVQTMSEDSGWIALTFNDGISDAWGVIQSQYRKIGKLVYLHVCAQGPSANWTVLATLPEGYRPHQSIDMTGRYDSHQHCNINISNSGEITFISTDGTLDASKQISFAAVFFVE